MGKEDVSSVSANTSYTQTITMSWDTAKTISVQKGPWNIPEKEWWHIEVDQFEEKFNIKGIDFDFFFDDSFELNFIQPRDKFRTKITKYCCTNGNKTKIKVGDTNEQ